MTHLIANFTHFLVQFFSNFIVQYGTCMCCIVMKVSILEKHRQMSCECEQFWSDILKFKELEYPKTHHQMFG